MVDAISSNIDAGAELTPAQRAFLDHKLIEAEYVVNLTATWAQCGLESSLM